MRRTTLCIALLALAASLASGCGYQLRGASSLPESFTRVYVQTRSSALRNAIDELLSSGGGAQVPNEKGAAVKLLVDYEDLSERLLSVDPNTGKAREFEVSYSARFLVKDADGAVVVPHQEVKIVRDYVFDGDAVIGKSRERGVLQTEMRRDAARQIFHRIRAAYRARG